MTFADARVRFMYFFHPKMVPSLHVPTLLQHQGMLAEEWVWGLPATEKDRLLDELGEQASKLLADFELESLTMCLADNAEWMWADMTSAAASSSGMRVKSRVSGGPRVEAQDDNDANDVSDITVSKRLRLTKRIMAPSHRGDFF